MATPSTVAWLGQRATTGGYNPLGRNQHDKDANNNLAPADPDTYDTYNDQHKFYDMKLVLALYYSDWYDVNGNVVTDRSDFSGLTRKLSMPIAEKARLSADRKLGDRKVSLHEFFHDENGALRHPRCPTDRAELEDYSELALQNYNAWLETRIQHVIPPEQLNKLTDETSRIFGEFRAVCDVAIFVQAIVTSFLKDGPKTFYDMGKGVSLNMATRATLQHITKKLLSTPAIGCEDDEASILHELNVDWKLEPKDFAPDWHVFRQGKHPVTLPWLTLLTHTWNKPAAAVALRTALGKEDYSLPASIMPPEAVQHEYFLANHGFPLDEVDYLILTMFGCPPRGDGSRAVLPGPIRDGTSIEYKGVNIERYALLQRPISSVAPAGIRPSEHYMIDLAARMRATAEKMLSDSLSEDSTTKRRYGNETESLWRSFSDKLEKETNPAQKKMLAFKIEMLVRAHSPFAFVDERMKYAHAEAPNDQFYSVIRHIEALHRTYGRNGSGLVKKEASIAMLLQKLFIDERKSIDTRRAAEKKKDKDKAAAKEKATAAVKVAGGSSSAAAAAGAAGAGGAAPNPPPTKKHKSHKEKEPSLPGVSLVLHTVLGTQSTKPAADHVAKTKKDLATAAAAVAAETEAVVVREVDRADYSYTSSVEYGFGSGNFRALGIPQASMTTRWDDLWLDPKDIELRDQKKVNPIMSQLAVVKFPQEVLEDLMYQAAGFGPAKTMEDDKTQLASARMHYKIDTKRWVFGTITDVYAIEPTPTSEEDIKEPRPMLPTDMLYYDIMIIPSNGIKLHFTAAVLNMLAHHGGYVITIPRARLAALKMRLTRVPWDEIDVSKEFIEAEYLGFQAHLRASTKYADVDIPDEDVAGGGGGGGDVTMGGGAGAAS